MTNIVTRFAPSPTGYLHVGGARTALFNYLYARANKGKFILRIEDTDKVRSTKESKEAIFEALKWLGIDWDEGPYFQSERFEIYQQYIQKLISEGKAYYCTCSSERLDAVRKEAMSKGLKPKYDGKCRDLNLEKSENAVIRFKAPVFGDTILKDIIKGNIIFQNSELDDFIIARSDGSPTYNFVVVIDDITMGINTIIRGDDHVNNTPKQIILYEALNADLPFFGHVPMVLGKDRARLSKRHGAMSVTAYRDMGYLPEAMINYLVRLGWSYGDEEFFTKDDLIEKFTLKNIGKAAGIFDMDKLLSINFEHIKSMKPKNLFSHLDPFLKKYGVAAESGDFTNGIIKTLNKRSKTLVDMAQASLFYFQDSVLFDEKAFKKFLKPEIKEPFNIIIKKLEEVEVFNEKNLENAFLYVLEKTGLKFGKIAQPVRVALTGGTISPGIFEMIEVLGKEKTILRLEKAIEKI
jgi:glutamyl-tRNA synthetase